MKIRVYYENTDMAGIVYHAEYIKFCERARSEIFFENSRFPSKDSGYFVAKELSCNYVKASVLGDILEVKSRVLEIKNASFKLNQTIYKDEKTIFTMDIILAFVKDNKPCKIPQTTKEFIKSKFL